MTTFLGIVSLLCEFIALIRHVAYLTTTDLYVTSKVEHYHYKVLYLHYYDRITDPSVYAKGDETYVTEEQCDIVKTGHKDFG